ncbi:MAG: phospholipid carrier-dependent glycosyltransferase [Xanthomonadales bacterium]|nr:phospholipid carrier-dependent glycosyltransferase [Xanthomonadales bacterium]
MIDPKQLKRFTATVILLCAVLWFGMLGQRDLFDPDEGRYAGIPAAMVDSGDWLTPRLNDFKYFEKPVLQYWGTAVAFKIFGKSNASARLWTALLGFSTALFSMLVAFRLYGARPALYTFLLSISYLMVVAFGHYLTLDMALSAFLVMGIGSLVLAHSNRSDEGRTRNWMLAGWAALALATLTKGLVAIVLPAATVVVYSVWQRDWDLWKKLHLFKGVLLFLLITAPWFVMVSIANPEFPEFFFIHEHFDRYTSDVHSREGPLYYFIPVLMLGVSPWLITSLRSLVSPGFKWMPDKPGQFDPDRFMWTFVVVTFCFFSLGQSKLPGYILPVLPIIAVISGGQIASRGAVLADRWVMLFLGLLFAVGAFSIELLASNHYPAEQWAAYRPWIIGSGVLFLLSFAVLSIRKIDRLPAFAGVAVLSLAAGLLIVSGANSLAESRSSKVIADIISETLPAGVPVFSFQYYPEAAVFYLGRPVTIVEYEGEMAMGVRLEPEKFIRTQDEFLAVWQNLDQAAVVLKLNRLKNLKVDELQGTVVYKGPKTMVIIKL